MSTFSSSTFLLHLPLFSTKTNGMVEAYKKRHQTTKVKPIIKQPELNNE
jgi:hypothetical protein